MEEVRHSYDKPAPDIVMSARKAYPSCECYKGFIYAWYHGPKWAEIMDKVREMHNQMCPKKTSHKGNGVYQGAHAFTLTKSPKDPQSVGDMLKAVKKIMGQKSCKVKKYAWYYEDKGIDEWGAPLHPHIHGMYETESGGKIEDKHWKRYWPIWKQKDADGNVIQLGAGHTGGYHRPVRSDEKYSQYIKKDGGMGASYGFLPDQ